MSNIQRKVMEGFYRDAAGDPTKLPWHTDTLAPFVVRAIEEREGPTRVLDVGCGGGVHAALLSRLGAQVTALDDIPAAIAMARALAAERGAQVELVESDLFRYSPSAPFDVVHDSGCMHNMGAKEVARYRAKVLEWLVPGGDFVLGHWGKRHALDWRPIGPRRRTPVKLAQVFAPELLMRDAVSQDERVPLPFGPWVRMSCYWFRRLGAV